MKIIFLDIDNVLNSDVYTESEMYKQATAGMSDAKIMLVAHHLHLDPDALKLINDLVNRSGAEVVLSSTWRTKYSPAEVTKMMQGRGATFTVTASTPDLTRGRMSRYVSRGAEISAYLRGYDVKPEYVILDDRYDMDHHKEHLVQTEMKYGLTKEHVEKALEILKVEKK
jgi:hypothetical protein